jgi:hypothetical protein
VEITILSNKFPREKQPTNASLAVAETHKKGQNNQGDKKDWETLRKA